jgi:hypothetical protein
MQGARSNGRHNAVLRSSGHTTQHTNRAMIFLAVVATVASVTLPCALAGAAAAAATSPSAAAAAAAGSSGREKVNFDFAFRFRLDPPPPPGPPPPPPHPPAPPIPPSALPKRLATCQHCEENVNYGTGSLKVLHTGTYTDCCTACAHYGGCKAWDWNPDGGACYLKDNASGPTKEKRWSGKMPTQVVVEQPGTAEYYIAQSAAQREEEKRSFLSMSEPSAPSHSGPGSNASEAQVGYDDSTWELVDTPHDMLINQKFDGRNSKGMAYLPRNSGWYRKHFSLPTDWKGKSVWLYIEGSFHKTFSYLNGVPLGFHQAGYTSFWLRLDNVTGVQFGGKNVLALYVDASFGTGWWYEGGGLIRHQYLVATSTTHLEPDGTWSYTVDVGTSTATVKTSAEITNHGKSVDTASIRATITDSEGASVGSSTSLPISIPVGATVMSNTSKALTGIKLWSVQTPTLYTVTVDVLSKLGGVLDTYNYSIGIRTLEYSATDGLHLNGENVKVRGFCDHSNFAGVGGAVPDRVNLYRTQMLRSVGGTEWHPLAMSDSSYLRLSHLSLALRNAS